MNLKGIGKIFHPQADEEANQEPKGARTCEVGHPLDPSWGDTCPYCDAIKRGRDKSAPIANIPASASANDRRTRVGEPVPNQSRATKVDAPDQSGSPRPQRPDTRRITGVLITFTWQAAGDLFAIREGKNRIGAGNASEEGQRACEIQVMSDPAMSKEHAVILCRHGRYEIADLNSSNGTFLNGEMISSQAVPLPNNSKLKTGDTVWRFLKIESDAAAQPVDAEEPEPDDTTEGRRRDITDIG